MDETDGNKGITAMTGTAEISDNTTLSTAFGALVQNHDVALQKHTLEMKKYLENPGTRDKPPVFASNRTTTWVEIGPAVVVEKCLSKLHYRDWTFKVKTKRQPDGRRVVRVNYVFAPGCGTYYQVLPEMVA